MQRREVFVVAGEASGDVQGAAVVAELKRQRPELHFFGVGGPALAAQGVELILSTDELSVMGLVEVLPALPRLYLLFNALLDEARARRPEFALLVDAPDFNLRLAKRLTGVPTYTLVAPSVWAWREGRVHTLRKHVRCVFCILPFEEAFLRERGVHAHYVGNPIAESTPLPVPKSQRRAALGLPADGLLLALLPGSRRSEVKRHLPPMLDAARRFVTEHPGTRLAIPMAPGLPRELFAAEEATLLEGRAAELLGAADLAIVGSGTATLEAALMGCPFVSVYRMNPVSYAGIRPFIRVASVCLPNLIDGQPLVPEFIQGNFRPERVAEALDTLLRPEAQQRFAEGVERIRQKLGPPGAAKRTADLLLADLQVR